MKKLKNIIPQLKEQQAEMMLGFEPRKLENVVFHAPKLKMKVDKNVLFINHIFV
jgi:hypothetical protein